MKRPIKFAAGLCASLFVAAFATHTSAAEPYPTKPIRMVVAFAPGGSADLNARVVGQQLGKELGGTVIIENKGGAGGNLGAVEAKRSAPDGYNLFYATSAIVLALRCMPSPASTRTPTSLLFR